MTLREETELCMSWVFAKDKSSLRLNHSHYIEILIVTVGAMIMANTNQEVFLVVMINGDQINHKFIIFHF